MQDFTNSGVFLHCLYYHYLNTAVKEVQYILYMKHKSFMNHLWIRGSKVDVPGSEPWGGWAVSAGRAHKVLCSVSPGQTPTSSAWCTPLSDPVQRHRAVRQLMVLQLVQIQTKSRNLAVWYLLIQQSLDHVVGHLITQKTFYTELISSAEFIMLFLVSIIYSAAWTHLIQAPLIRLSLTLIRQHQSRVFCLWRK